MPHNDDYQEESGVGVNPLWAAEARSWREAIEAIKAKYGIDLSQSGRSEDLRGRDDTPQFRERLEQARAERDAQSGRADG